MLPLYHAAQSGSSVTPRNAATRRTKVERDFPARRDFGRPRNARTQQEAIDALVFIDREFNHPVESDVGQTGLILGAATADVGLVSGEPYLVELLRLIFSVRPQEQRARGGH
jgi:hypothetical protein